MAVLKLNQYPGVQLAAGETLEAQRTEQALRAARLERDTWTVQALRAARLERDIKLHELRTEFIARESKLHQEFLDRVAEFARS